MRNEILVNFRNKNCIKIDLEKKNREFVKKIHGFFYNFL